MYYSIPGLGMLWYCWDQNHHSILCTIGRGYTGHDHLPSNLNIVCKLTVLWIKLLHLLVGIAHYTATETYPKLVFFTLKEKNKGFRTLIKKSTNVKKIKGFTLNNAILRLRTLK